mmetsp:Transcript_32412/g.53607  ORF Transcript_32412/g.53607 Transcript_32412/m.53607 type:complete len:248 (+) Transcript_32412:592-1335(+)
MLEEIKDIRQICVRTHNVVPVTVNVIGHEIHEIKSLRQCRQIIAWIQQVTRNGDSHTQLQVFGCCIKCCFQVKYKLSVVRLVFWLASPAVVAWKLPIQVQTIKPVFLAKRHSRGDKDGSILRCIAHVGKESFAGTRIAKGPTTHSYQRFQVGVDLLESHKFAVQSLLLFKFGVVRFKLELVIDPGEGVGQMRVCKGINITRCEWIAALISIGGPTLVVPKVDRHDILIISAIIALGIIRECGANKIV